MCFCEDTRVTAKLFNRYQISTTLKPYHDHNAAKVRPGILKDLQNGAAIALVSDAATPLISDPGWSSSARARRRLPGHGRPRGQRPPSPP